MKKIIALLLISFSFGANINAGCGPPYIDLMRGSQFLYGRTLVTTPPFVTYDTLAISVTAGDSTFLALGTDNGCGPVTGVQWFKDGIQTHSDAYASYNNYFDTLSGPGNYTCTFTFNESGAYFFTVHIYIPDVTGIFEPNNTSALSVYPNPSQGIFTIDDPGNVKTKVLTVYDSNGRMLRSQKETNSSFILDLSGYPPGVYILLYDDADGKRRTKKLMIN